MGELQAGQGTRRLLDLTLELTHSAKVLGHAGARILVLLDGVVDVPLIETSTT